MKHAIREELQGVLLFVGAIWCVFLLDSVLPGTWTNWGITPRSLWGLVGIPLAPFLHKDLGHIVSNTLPLCVLLLLMAGSRTRTWQTVVEIILTSGSLLWLFGRNGNADTGQITHVGASALIYGLIAFLIVAGFREKRLVPLLVAIGVGLIYGTTLLYGILPSIGGGVSWDGHLSGALAGAAIAYFTLGPRPAPTTSPPSAPLA